MLYVRLIRAFASRLNISITVKLLTEHHLEFLSLKGDFTSPSKYTLVKMPHRWKSHIGAEIPRFEFKCLFWC